MRLFKGYWEDKLENNQELLIGGSIFSDELSIKLILDFNSFNNELGHYINSVFNTNSFNENKEVANYFNQFNSDSYLLFTCSNVMAKTQILLNVNPNIEINYNERKKIYLKDYAKLSETKGLAMCAERAALGKYLLDKIIQGYKSSIMGGVMTTKVDESVQLHTFIVINQEYIFDITNPNMHNLPRLMKTLKPFNYELFKDTKDLVMSATDVMTKEVFYYGVGDPDLIWPPKIIT